MLRKTLKLIVTSALLVIVVSFAFALNAATPVEVKSSAGDFMVTMLTSIIGGDKNEQDLPADELRVSTASNTFKWSFSEEDTYDADNAMPISNGRDFLVALKSETNISLTDDIVLSDYSVIERDITIHANGHSIYSSINRGFLVEASKITVTINDAVIDMDEGSADRVLQINSDCRNVKLVLNNCRLNLIDSGATYGVNIAKDTKNCDVELNGCTINAFVGLYIHGTDQNVTINNCSFTMNPVFGGQGGIGVLIAEDAVANVTINDCSFTSTDKYSIAIACEKSASWENTVTFENCTVDADPVKEVKKLES